MYKRARVSKRAAVGVSLISTAVAGTLVSAFGAGGRTVPMTVQGVVVGSVFTPTTRTSPSSTLPSYYQGATVCVDVNNNGVCDVDEPATVTDGAGGFLLHSLGAGPIVADISTAATNGGRTIAERVVFRTSIEQITEGAASAGDAAVATPAEAHVVVSPLSTEVARMMEADNLPYAAAKQNLAGRLGVPLNDLLGDVNALSDNAVRNAILTESVILTNRFTLATRMVDRGDVSPAALAQNPQATGPAITIREAQQTAMNLERIPRYDNMFVIVLENKSAAQIRNSPFAPKINAYLSAGNQFTSYYATGIPSEPNYTAMGAADDFGIIDDNAWNCLPAGDTADLPEDPLPAGLPPCTNAVSHNIKNRANMFTALNAAGMTWRVYNESMNPGRDWRLNSASDATILAPDHVYSASDPVGAIGNQSLLLPLPGGLYATKHNPTMAFQEVRSQVDFQANNRTMGGGQWDDAMKASGNVPAGWNFDQLGTDLANGDMANLNFLVPDQCDDMHGVTVRGTLNGTLTPASDCSGSAIIFRSDNYVDSLIKKIQASPVWKNTQKRAAIVIMFDEGTQTSGFNSCCGWNHRPGESLGVLARNPDGTVSIDSIAGYITGNTGHGVSVFGVLTNQPAAPKGVVDSDAYSHFSFVRTLQDMFGIADPGNDWSYMNRSKYTEQFIAAHLQFLPEYQSTTDVHFDGVRPMNHAFVIPDGYVQKNGTQIGPDADQRNPWALK